MAETEENHKSLIKARTIN